MRRLRANLSITRFRSLLKDTFLRNSFFIFLSSITSSGFGLLFWMVAAWYYDIESVGVTSTLISTSGLIVALGMLGMDQSMIRYFPVLDRSMILGSVVKIAAPLAMAIGAVFLLGSSLWMPDLVASDIVHILFILLIGATSVAYIAHTAFVGSRNAQNGWYQNILLGVRVILLVAFVVLQDLGILFAMLVSYAITLPVSGILLFRSGLRLGAIDWSFLRKSFWFSTGNYVATILNMLPTMAMPILVFSLIGAAEAAIYYMALSIAAIVFLIPATFNTSLYVEGSHGESLAKTFRRSLTITYAILVPCIIAFMLLGPYILGILGAQYRSDGLGILNILLVSGLFFTLFQQVSTYLKVKEFIRGVVLMGAVNSGSFLALSVILAAAIGKDGIGYSWVFSFALGALVGLIYMRHTRGRSGPLPINL
ncbi:MAG: hypothetical protein A4E30_00129 [Methanomassiliicoccales archaeon PtaB.Bin215]|nr:MAG: hypothetical protein A4E30_00129 [Methanomassiliicoccales archaeon PtaB.Bin215]